jgi:hypothetical protein
MRSGVWRMAPGGRTIVCAVPCSPPQNPHHITRTSTERDPSRIRHGTQSTASSLSLDHQNTDIHIQNNKKAGMRRMIKPQCSVVRKQAATEQHCDVRSVRRVGITKLHHAGQTWRCEDDPMGHPMQQRCLPRQHHGDVDRASQDPWE